MGAQGTNPKQENAAVDDRGTGQTEAIELIKNLRDEEFESSNEDLALALGRSVEQVEAWFDGSEAVDDDVVMKARGIAQTRGVTIED
jgi:hypothetical protein